VVPSIHPIIGIDSRPAVNHQPGFTDAAAGPAADQAIFDGALLLAWTAIDAAQSQGLRARLMGQLTFEAAGNDAVPQEVGEGDTSWELQSDVPAESEGTTWDTGDDRDPMVAEADASASAEDQPTDDPTRGEHFDAWEAEYQAALATLEAGE
jgi:hypothetical protein